jgi:hypothetical protein
MKAKATHSERLLQCLLICGRLHDTVHAVQATLQYGNPFVKLYIVNQGYAEGAGFSREEHDN